MLKIRRVSKSYGPVTALIDVDLDIEPGEIVGLLGPNGAGKTTLVSIVAGLRRPDRGTVHVGGIDVTRRPDEAHELIGLAPQDLGIYPVVTARENLVYFGEIAGLRRRALSTRIDEVADALALTHLLPRRAQTLSGGEKRRLHTAMALLHRPALLLLDEPTAGADVQTRGRLLDLVKALAEDGAAICYSTHYLQEIEQLDASVALLEGGRVIARDAVTALVSRHATAVVELSFDGPAPDLDGRAAREGSLLRITTDRPTAAAAEALAALGSDAARLRSVEIVKPSLETVYLALTGRRYEDEEDEDEVVDVAVP